jgi:hypothetical protein
MKLYGDEMYSEQIWKTKNLKSCFTGNL